MDSNGNMFSKRPSIDWGDARPYRPPVEQKLTSNPMISPTVPQSITKPGSSAYTEAHMPKLAIPRLVLPQQLENVKRMSPAWTLAEIEKLMSLRAQGMRFGDIVKQLPGRTERGCGIFYLKYVRNKVSVLEWSEEDLRVLKEEGFGENSAEPVNEVPIIASQPLEMAPKEASSTSKGSVPDANREERHEFLPPIIPVPRPWTGAEDEALLSMLLTGFTFAELHARFPDRSLGECHRRYRFFYDKWESKRAPDDSLLVNYKKAYDSFFA